MKHFKGSIAPLFWLKGEPQDVLFDGLSKLRESGIYECILEARPFPGWLEKTWFDTLKGLFSEAERTGMRLWLFDDSHFPSGFADGRLSEPHRRRLLRIKFGESAGAGRFQFRVPPLAPGESLFRAVEAPFVPPSGFDGDTARDVTEKIAEDGTLELEFPGGRHRVFFLIVTREGGEHYTREYVNMLDPAATDEFVHLVLDTHYRELKHWFDNGVCAGFFSDEPRFGNAPSYDSLPDGKTPELPFSQTLAERLSGEPAAFWPALWHDCGERTPEFRARFMNNVSKLYSECFPQKIGAWCRAHGVEYIGHVIEDNGGHSRLGYGNGHFFRSITGQSAAGIDTVLDQNRPGFETGFHSSFFGPHDADFFHWGLAKLCSSAAHLMPEFGGCALCESFGAYGWNFGLENMKLMTDHLAVRGINFFVPHAFSNAEFPDPDCPPHFYARGHNPQWPLFHLWREYCDRVCAMLSGGIHLSGIAVLYHAEAEWSTKPFTPFQTIARQLMQRQLDFDVVPFDLLEKNSVANGVLRINGEEFRVLIVPNYAWLAPEHEETLRNLSRAGLNVVYESAFHPERFSSGIEIVSGAKESLRILRFRKDDVTNVFCVNESVEQPVAFKIAGASRRNSHLFDAVSGEKFETGTILLEPGESLFAILDGQQAEPLPKRPAGFTPVPNCPLEHAGQPFRFHWDGRPGRFFLSLGHCAGIAEIEFNGHRFAPLFSTPYRVEITEFLKEENTFSVRITTTPFDKKCRDTVFDSDIACLAPDSPVQPEILAAEK